MLRLLLGLLIPAILLGTPLGAMAFTIDEGFVLCEGGGWCYGSAGDVADARATLEWAPRWNADPTADPTLADGIQVAVEPGFGAALAAIMPPSAAEYEAALVAAFQAWETPELSFDIEFDVPPDREINVLAVDSSHWAFSGYDTAAGVAWFDCDYVDSLELTNGQVQQPGWVMTGANIYVAVDRVDWFFSLLAGFGLVDESDRLPRFQNFMTHEIGHAMGLDHPNESPWANFDTDLDPKNEMVIDPWDPPSGVIVSPNVDSDAIMIPVKTVEALLLTELTPDDRGGMDVLYPSVSGLPTPTPTPSLPPTPWPTPSLPPTVTPTPSPTPSLPPTPTPTPSLPPTPTPSLPPTPTPTPTPVGTPLTEEQQSCVNEMNRCGEKVAKAQLEEVERCLKDFQADKLGTSFEACATGDRSGKVQTASGRTAKGEGRRCDSLAELPPFAYTDSATVNQSAVDGALMLTRDLFGDPFEEGNLARKALDADAARCQKEMLKRADKLAHTIVKQIVRAKKKALEDETTDGAPALQAALAAVFASDEVAKQEARLAGKVRSKCLDLPNAPDTLFPGACADAALGNVEACAIAAARCRACLQINAFDDLSFDCDQVDDQTANQSCPLTMP